MKLTQPAAGAADEMSGNYRGGGLNVRDCGAVGDGQASCTAAIQRAVDRCAQVGGGTVFVPAGHYVTGTIWLRSNVNLHVDAGAVLQGSRSAVDYPIWVSQWEGGAKAAHAPLIAGEGLSNVAITGRGVIDGRGQVWWDRFRQNELEHTRPRLLRLVDCRDVLIEGITCVNAAFWTLNPTACDNLTISRVTVRNPPDSPNTDGINPDSCSNVQISDCHIDVGDDCLTIKSGSEDDGRAAQRPCENITVTNCTMLRGHGGVVIGSEMSGGVRNVAISNCVFRGTDRGIRLKSRRGRGGAVEDLRVNNLVMDGVLCPIVVNLFYGCGAWDHSKVTDRKAQPVTAGTPRIRRLRFSNISARRVKYAAAFLLGLPEMSVEDVVLEGLSIYLDPDNTTGGSPAMAPGITDMCRAGMVIENARDITVRRVDLHDQLGPAVSIRRSHDVRVSDVCARSDGHSSLLTLDGAGYDPSDGNASSLGRDWKPAARRVSSHASANGNGDGNGQK